jgi:hypothetical protein
MKRFLRKAIFFMIFPVLYMSINMLINSYIYNNEEVKLKKKNILIIGDSHPRRSLNPKYFKSAQNIAQPGESLVLTYWKLKKSI